MARDQGAGLRFLKTRFFLFADDFGYIIFGNNYAMEFS